MGTWSSQDVPRQQLMNKAGSLFLDSINTMVYAENLLFFWESGIVVHARQKVPPLPGPIKTLAFSLMSFPG